MKINQEKTFNGDPVTITLETREEAEAFWDIMLHYDNPADTAKKPAKDMATVISDWFGDEYH
jgi:hypothetical protein